MANVSPKGDQDLRLYINDTSNGGVFHFVRDDSGVSVVKIDEDGHIKSDGPVVLQNTASSTSDIVAFYAGITGGTKYAALERGGSIPPYFYVNLRSEQSGEPMRIEGKFVQLLARDQTGTIVEFIASTTKHAQLETGSGKLSFFWDPTGTGDSLVFKRGSTTKEALEISSAHTFSFKEPDTGNTTRMQLTLGTTTGSDAKLTVGMGNGRRGVVAVGRDDTSGSEKAGALVLTNKDGTSYYLWVDASGDLRIENGNPASDGAGTVVGTQT